MVVGKFDVSNVHYYFIDETDIQYNISPNVLERWSKLIVLNFVLLFQKIYNVTFLFRFDSGNYRPAN